MVVRELLEMDSTLVLRLLQGLTDKDRTARFSRTMSDDAIRQYVSDLDWSSMIVFGAFDDAGRPLGVLELRDQGNSAELFLSVIAGARRQGVGRTLIDIALLKARVLWKESVVLNCLADNEPMRWLALRAGFTSNADPATGRKRLSRNNPKGASAVAANAVEPSGTITYTAALYSRNWDSPLQRLLSSPWSIDTHYAPVTAS